MILSVFLAIGESWEEFERNGQSELLLKNNFHYYAQHFNKVYVFSYGRGQYSYNKGNIIILPNRFHLHRFIYAVILPFLYFKVIKKSCVVRGMQLTGGIPAVIAKHVFKKPTVINYGYDYIKMAKIERKEIQMYLYKIIQNLILASVDAIIITSKHLYQKVNGRFKKKIILIPNGVNVKHFKPHQVRKEKTILYVGRLERQKNLFTLLEAVSKLKERVKITFIGAGSLHDELISYAREHRVSLTIIKNIPNAKLVNYFVRAKLFILPSLVEGHPKALIEAMSCGIAVIGTKVEGIKEVIKHRRNGLLVKSNATHLAKAIMEVLHNQVLQQKLGKNARLEAIKLYNVDTNCKKEISLLKKLCSSS